VSVATGMSPPRLLPLVEVPCSRVLICRMVPAYSVSRSRRDVSRFRCACAVFPPCRPPEAIAPGSSSCASGLLQRTRTPARRRSACARPRPPPHGLHSPSRCQSAASTSDDLLALLATRRIPLLLRSVLGVSHTLDGFLRHEPCEFISPRNHVRDSLFRGFSPRTAVRARHSPLPSCRSRLPPTAGFPTAPGTNARLQGFPLAEDSLRWSG